MFEVTIIVVEQGGMSYYLHSPCEPLADVSRVCAIQAHSGILTQFTNAPSGPIHPCDPSHGYSFDELCRLLSSKPSNRVLEFVKTELTPADGAKIPLQTVHSLYNEYCERGDVPQMGLKKLGKLLRTEYEIPMGQRIFEGKNVTCLLGFTLKRPTVQ